MIDVDAFIERAAIMEYDGGLSRFRAETLAAQAQGAQRREVLDEIGRRDSQGQRNIGAAGKWDDANDVSAMQRAPQEGKA